MRTQVEPLERFLDAIEHRDRDAISDAITADAAWHIPGRNAIAGFHKGQDEILDLMQRIDLRTERSFAIEAHDLVSNSRHAILLGHLTASRGDDHLSISGVATFHLADGKLADMWLAVSDQYRFDEFFA